MKSIKEEVVKLLKKDAKVAKKSRKEHKKNVLKAIEWFEGLQSTPNMTWMLPEAGRPKLNFAAREVYFNNVECVCTESFFSYPSATITLHPSSITDDIGCGAGTRRTFDFTQRYD